MTIFSGGSETESSHLNHLHHLNWPPLTEHQHLLLLEVLVHKAGDFALVSPGEPVVRVDNSESPVLLVSVVVGHVVQVQFVLEQLSDDLGALAHAGHPLVDRDGGPIEIPLQVQLGLLLVKVGVVTVQHELRPGLDNLRTNKIENVDSIDTWRW